MKGDAEKPAFILDLAAEDLKETPKDEKSSDESDDDLLLQPIDYSRSYSVPVQIAGKK